MLVKIGGLFQRVLFPFFRHSKLRFAHFKHADKLLVRKIILNEIMHVHWHNYGNTTKPHEKPYKACCTHKTHFKTSSVTHYSSHYKQYNFSTHLTFARVNGRRKLGWRQLQLTVIVKVVNGVNRGRNRERRYGSKGALLGVASRLWIKNAFQKFERDDFQPLYCYHADLPWVDVNCCLQ